MQRSASSRACSRDNHWSFALFVLHEPMIGEALRADVERFLAPAPAPGDVWVMNNLSRAQGRRHRPGARCSRASILSSYLFVAWLPLLAQPGR
jgi:hypothetical protein